MAYEMPKLCISVLDPQAQVIEQPDGIWILSGIDDAQCRRVEAQGRTADQLAQDICRRAGDATVIMVHLANGRPTMVNAWKGLTSRFEVYYSIRSNGDILICDHFRNILSSIPVSDREPSQEAMVDHFLFHNVDGTSTYCRNIKRLGRGEKISIDLVSSDVETTLFDRIEDCSKPGSINAYLDRVDHALAAALEPVQTETGIVNLFSGGIDSTLVQTYFGSVVPALQIALDSPDLDFQADYAVRAAKLMDVEVQRHFVKESAYLTQLEETTEALGMPLRHSQLVLFRSAFMLDFQIYISAWDADHLYGEGVRLAKIASFFSSPVGLFMLSLGTSLIPAAARQRWRLLLPNAQSLGRNPTSISGYWAYSAAYVDRPLVESAFGLEAVRDRLHARLGYVLRRVTLSAPETDTFSWHMEMAHWQTYLCDEGFMHMRQVAHGLGKTILSPFHSRRVLSSVLQVPAAERYIRGFREKFLLKLLLKKRLSSYPIDQRKAGANIPRERYYTSGPLSNIWERYPVPDCFDGEIRRRIVDHAGPITWHAIAYAIWQEKVLRNGDLQPLPAKVNFTWKL